MNWAHVAPLARNEAAALAVIRARGQATRGDVAAALDLSMAMAARMVGRLLAAGLLREAGRSTVAGPGRQALLVEIEPTAAYVVGVDIGTEMLHLLLTDLQAGTQIYREVPCTELVGLSQDDVIAAIATLVRELIASGTVPADRVAAVGVAVTGIIDSDRGVCVMRSHTPGWEDFAIGPALKAAIGLPVVVEETARAKALAELRLGAARGARHFLYVDAGTAIGAGIVIDGHPFHGIGGLAGELGHVTVDPSGTLCRCGNRGCVQATASARSVVGQAHDLLERDVYSSLSRLSGALTITDITAAANHGDKLALGLLTDAGERLGEAISMALNLLGMDLVVVGGTLAHYSPVVLEAAERIIRLRVLPMVPQRRAFVSSTLGSSAAARGAVLQAIDRLFADLSGQSATWSLPPDGQGGESAGAVAAYA